jgi:hypothetical protein
LNRLLKVHVECRFGSLRHSRARCEDELLWITGKKRSFTGVNQKIDGGTEKYRPKGSRPKQ